MLFLKVTLLSKCAKVSTKRVRKKCADNMDKALITKYFFATYSSFMTVRLLRYVEILK